MNKSSVQAQSYIKVPRNKLLLMHHQIDGFDAIAETQDLRFLSNAAAARQPVQQPKSRSAYAARGRYAVLGSIYYAENHEVLRESKFTLRVANLEQTLT